MQFLFIYGFTVLMILPLKKKSVSAQPGECEFAPDQHGRLKANCQSKGFTSIPQKMNAKIEVLDISRNNISTLNKDDLKDYQNLWGLIMIHLPVTSFPSGFFQHTPSLKMLNISNTHISNWNEIPGFIQNLNFTYCKLETIDLSHMVDLKRLWMRNCTSLKKMPTIYKSAPLEILDVKFSDLSDADYSQIAPFCRLRYFGLLSKSLEEGKHVLQCCGLRKWGFTWNMTGFKNQNCSRNVSHPFCHAYDIKLDEQSLNQYRDCTRNVRLPKFILFIIILAVSFALIITSSILGFLYYHYKIHLPKRRAKENATGTEIEGETEYDENSIDSDRT